MDPLLKNMIVDEMMKDVNAQTDEEKAYLRTCFENIVEANDGGNRSDGGFYKNLVIDQMMKDENAQTDAERAFTRTWLEKTVGTYFDGGGFGSEFSGSNSDPLKFDPFK